MQCNDCREIFQAAGLAHAYHALSNPSAGEAATIDQCARLADLCYSRRLNPYAEVDMTRLPGETFPPLVRQFSGRWANILGFPPCIFVDHSWLALSEAQALAEIERIGRIPA